MYAPLIERSVTEHMALAEEAEADAPHPPQGLDQGFPHSRRRWMRR